MKRESRRTLGATLLLASTLGATPATAQQVNGVPGPPAATISIDGKQIPAPPSKFGGKIERNAAQSKP